MQAELEIAFHGIDASPSVEQRVRERVDRLEQFFGRIIRCRVVVDAPHRQHRKGNRFNIRIEIRVPGSEFTIDREPGDVNAHHDVYIALRDAFDTAERKLRRWKETHSGRH